MSTVVQTSEPRRRVTDAQHGGLSSQESGGRAHSRGGTGMDSHDMGGGGGPFERSTSSGASTRGGDALDGFTHQDGRRGKVSNQVASQLVRIQAFLYIPNPKP